MADRLRNIEIIDRHFDSDPGFALGLLRNGSFVVVNAAHPDQREWFISACDELVSRASRIPSNSQTDNG